MKNFFISIILLITQINSAQNTFPPMGSIEVYGNGVFNGAVISSMASDIGGEIRIKNSSKTANGTSQNWSIYNMTGGYGNSLQFWAYDNLGCVDGGLCANKFTIMDNGNVGIGTLNPTSKFEVTGGGITTSLTNLSSTLTQRINTANPAISIGLGYLNSDMPFIQSFNNVSTSSNALNINPFGGNVGIGTSNPTSKLTVAGNINSREVKVTVDAGADFVFENNYNLPSLDAVDKYIKENKHLPEIASAEKMKKDGINLSEMNIKLLQQIEELTLYIIQQEKKNSLQTLEIENSKNEIQILKKENESFKNILERLSTIEEKLK